MQVRCSWWTLLARCWSTAAPQASSPASGTAAASARLPVLQEGLIWERWDASTQSQGRSSAECQEMSLPGHPEQPEKHTRSVSKPASLALRAKGLGQPAPAGPTAEPVFKVKVEFNFACSWRPMHWGVFSVWGPKHIGKSIVSVGSAHFDWTFPNIGRIKARVFKARLE